ncbi:MAG: hypothetical protein J0H55_13940 [Chitinophagaceae bacterium]|nr:hypothetical protein [Chitinophagaceae bacterium]
MINTYSYSEGNTILIAGLDRYTSTDIAYREKEYAVPDEDEELTRLCMEASESSLNEVWEDEDDAYWESFLKK